MAGGDYGRILHTFWTDPDIKRLPFEQKGLLLYYFTSPHSSMIGLYHCPFGYVAVETGLSIESIKEWTLGSLSRFVSYDEATEEILVHKAAKHQIGEDLKGGDNRKKAVVKGLAGAHSTTLVRKFLSLYPHWEIGFRASVDTVEGKAPSEAPLEAPSEAPSKPEHSRAVAVTEHEQSTNRTEPPADARARMAPDPVIDVVDVVEVPGDVGSRVIPLRPSAASELPFHRHEWGGRVAGSVVLQEWISLQPTPPSQRDRDRFSRTCRRLADAHSTGELALAFIGIEYIWPHAPPPVGNGEPWTPEDLEKRFAKAVPAAKSHPVLKQRMTEAEFDAAVARRAR